VPVGTKVNNFDMLRHDKDKAFIRNPGIEPNILQRVKRPRFVHVDVLDAADTPIRVINPHFERLQVFGNAGFRRELQGVRCMNICPIVIDERCAEILGKSDEKFFWGNESGVSLYESMSTWLLTESTATPLTRRSQEFAPATRCGICFPLHHHCSGIRLLNFRILQ